MQFDQFYQKLNFYNGFRGNHLGQNVRNDCGIISCFHINIDFDMCFARQIHVFPKNHFAVSLYKQFILLKETYMRSFFFLENVKYEASSFLRIHNAFVWGKMSVMTVGSFHVFI